MAVNRPESEGAWTLCYRHFDHHSVDTNMLVERYILLFYMYVMLAFFPSFHNKFKNNSCYLDHKVNRRLDDLLHVVCDVYIARKTKEVTN